MPYAEDQIKFPEELPELPLGHVFVTDAFYQDMESPGPSGAFYDFETAARSFDSVDDFDFSGWRSVDTDGKCRLPFPEWQPQYEEVDGNDLSVIGAHYCPRILLIPITKSDS